MGVFRVSSVLDLSSVWYFLHDDKLTFVVDIYRVCICLSISVALSSMLCLNIRK